MKVAIDVRSSKGGHAIRGIGRNTRELIDQLSKLNRQSGSKVIVEAVDFSNSNLSKYDLLHYTSFNPFFLSFKLHANKKVLITIHDLIQLLYPKNYPPGTKGKINYLIQKRLIKKVDGVLTISNTSKKDIVRFLGVDPKKVHVSYLAASLNFKDIRGNKGFLREVARKYNLPNKFVLYVGDVNYNKNIPTLIDACREAGQRLVICGKNAQDIESQLGNIKHLQGPRDYFRFLFNKPHPEIAHYKLILKMIKENNVLRVGYVADEELAALYNLASAYVQPSFYEGFGLQVLEAMACKTPVIVSRTNALVEIAGDAALVADPHNFSDMAKKISMSISDAGVRSELIRKGEKRAKEFSWEKAALDTLQVYKAIIGQKSS